jgi:signal transduction histidine kinase
MARPLFASPALSNGWRSGASSDLSFTVDVPLQLPVNQEYPVIRNGDILSNSPSQSTSFSGEEMSTAKLELEGLDSEAANSIHRIQVAQTVRAIPLLLLFHAVASLSLQSLAKFQVLDVLIGVWHVMATLVGLALAVCFVLWRRGRLHSKPERMLHGLELISLILGLVWAVPIAAVVQLNQHDSIVPVAGVTIAMLGIGVVSLMRVPAGAVVFLSLVTAALARSLYLALDSHQVLATLLCAIYCLVLIGVTLNSHMDFSRRTKAEVEVKRQNDVIRLLLHDFERDASDWLWETDKVGRLAYVSPRLMEVLQVEASSLLLRPLQDILGEHTSSAQLRELEKAMILEGPMVNLPIELTLHGNRLVWQMTAHPLADRDGEFSGHRGVCRDVTAAQDAQRRIEAAMDSSERASSAKSQFLAVMSHELRTPISAIVGFSELLAQDRDGRLPPESRREFAETILESSRHLQALISDLLDVTRIERGSFQLSEQQVEAAELVEVAIKLSREAAEKAGVSIVARLSDGITITGDVTRLKQVIINLLTNAVKFSNEGGIVNVDMLRGPQGRLVLAIKDAGIGISDEDLERVFDPFVQADSSLGRRYGGVGLGLPIARRIARLHEGDVVLSSAAGAGTTASLILPARRIEWPKVEVTDAAKVA